MSPPITPSDLNADQLIQRRVEVTGTIKTLEQERHAIDAELVATFGDDAIKGLQGQAQRDGRAQPLTSTYLCLSKEV
jgi:hypothetical protein